MGKSPRPPSTPENSCDDPLAFRRNAESDACDSTPEQSVQSSRASSGATVYFNPSDRSLDKDPAGPAQRASAVVVGSSQHLEPPDQTAERHAAAIPDYAVAAGRVKKVVEYGQLHRSSENPPATPPEWFCVAVLCPGEPSARLKEKLVTDYGDKGPLRALPGAGKKRQALRHTFLKDLSTCCKTPCFAVVKRYSLRSVLDMPDDESYPQEFKERYAQWYSQPGAQGSCTWVFMDPYFQENKDWHKDRVSWMRAVLIKTGSSLPGAGGQDMSDGHPARPATVITNLPWGNGDTEIMGTVALKAGEVAALVGGKLLDYQYNSADSIAGAYPGSLLEQLFQQQHIRFLFDAPFKKNNPPGPRQVELSPSECMMNWGTDATNLLTTMTEIMLLSTLSFEQVKGKKIVVHEHEILGKGSLGTVVYAGVCNEIPVAVKRIRIEYSKMAQRERKLMGKVQHKNVLNYLQSEDDKEFTNIALTRCKCNLKELMETDKFLDDAGLPTTLCEQITHGVVEGLKVLHQKNIVHRDLKPGNILIAEEKGDDGCTSMVAKIGDLGLSKEETGEDSKSISMSMVLGQGGTPGWQAPEQQMLRKISGSQIKHTYQTNKVDIFSLGCVLFYCFSGGKHPFGDTKDEIEKAVARNDEPRLELLRLLPMHQALLRDMLKICYWERPDIVTVAKHPVFWPSTTDAVTFLCDLSKALQGMPKHWQQGEASKASFNWAMGRELGWNDTSFSGWMATLDPSIREWISWNSARYNDNEASDLVRLIRNLKEHTSEREMMGNCTNDEYKRRIGCEVLRLLNYPETNGYDSFLQYFTSRFPNLVLAAWKWGTSLKREKLPNNLRAHCPGIKRLTGKDGDYRVHYCVSRIVNKFDEKIFSTSNSKSKGWLAKQIEKELRMAENSFDPQKFGFSGGMVDLIQSHDELLRMDGTKVFVADGAAHVEGATNMRGMKVPSEPDPLQNPASTRDLSLQEQLEQARREIEVLKAERDRAIEEMKAAIQERDMAIQERDYGAKSKQ